MELWKAALQAGSCTVCPAGHGEVPEEDRDPAPAGGVRSIAMAEKLISLDAAVKTLEKEISEFPIEQVFDPVYVRFKKRVVPRLLQDVINWLKKMPTVDAVEVVRCRNCRHRHTRVSCAGRPMDFFCADGER